MFLLNTKVHMIYSKCCLLQIFISTWNYRQKYTYYFSKVLQPVSALELKSLFSRIKMIMVL